MLASKDLRTAAIQVSEWMAWDDSANSIRILQASTHCRSTNVLSNQDIRILSSYIQLRPSLAKIQTYRPQVSNALSSENQSKTIPARLGGDWYSDRGAPAHHSSTGVILLNTMNSSNGNRQPEPPDIAGLRIKATALGVAIPQEADISAISELLHRRIAIINAADRGALLDLASHMEIPLEDSVPNVDIVEKILAIQTPPLAKVSERGLRLLAKLRNIPNSDTLPRKDVERILKERKRLRDRIRNKRRKLMGSMIGKMFDSSDKTRSEVLEENRNKNLKKRIQAEGVVGGISRTLRGAADDYIAEKLDEIEGRIDAKLDEIDNRLEQWRDKEVANRLKILKITLVILHSCGSSQPGI